MSMLGCFEKVQIQKSKITEPNMRRRKRKKSHAKTETVGCAIFFFLGGEKRVPSQSLRSLTAEA